MIKTLLKRFSGLTINRILLLAVSTFTLATTSAADLYVNDASLTGDVFTTAVGNDANPGTSAAPFATIQFAIDAAVTGDVIYVDAGTYVSGDIFVTTSVTLRGAKFGVPAGPAATPANRGTDETIIQGSIYYGQSRDNITIDGFTLNVGTALRGIESRGLNTVIINNILTGISTPAVQQAGISTRANAPNRVHSYVISNNNVRGFRAGIYMDGNTENPSLISFNYVTNCTTQGYELTASNGHTFRANVSENNSQGMVFSEGQNLIEQNTIIGNALIGIRLAASPQTFSNLLINNFFINNGVGLALTENNASAVNNVANYNSFTGNGLNIASAHSANFNGQCNWFGSIVPAVIAAQITGNVNYNPFLTDGTDTDLALDGFQPTTTCVVVPVILTDFSAVVRNYDVLLKWQTVSEVNSSHFIIERSLDNQEFSPIGRVEARGFSDVKVNYNFTDNKPVNFDRPTYYRLAMTDRDGTIKYSKIISVILKANASYVQQVYPNPVEAGALLHVKFISGQTQPVNISFINATGQILEKYTFQAFKGANEFNLKMPVHAAAGVNFIQIRSGEMVKQVPVHVR